MSGRRTRSVSSVPLPKLSGLTHRDRVPTRCLEPHPTSQSVRFLGTPINLSTLARRLNMDHSYLSRIFAGYRRPRWYFSRRLADGLGMAHDAFVTGIEHVYALRNRKKLA